jgi:hypothetical protein
MFKQVVMAGAGNQNRPASSLVSGNKPAKPTPMLESSHQINFKETNWMIQLGTIARISDRVIIKNFDANAISLSFLKHVIADNGLFVRACDSDLILEKISVLPGALRNHTFHPPANRSEQARPRL